jgi:tRNA 2-thiouridine synthesizing protein A
LSFLAGELQGLLLSGARLRTIFRFARMARSFVMPAGREERRVVSSPETRLDITAENCPLTFVRTKLCLERMPDGGLLRVRLRAGEPVENVPRAVADHGHEVLALQPLGADIFELLIRKRGP